ncbi:MAG: hypothetical protein A2Y40_01155 [Candidatus Margulisbacteria bacterium GWF2_35_9]|nr:MAG: hypothetical protein A2Y40_01155 [Candidatus Margulisbacteria bacterium GWF2_35_9]
MKQTGQGLMQVSRTKPVLFVLTYTHLGLFVVVDQLLLPMFHLGTFPFKISYFILVLGLLPALNHQGQSLVDRQHTQDFIRFSLLIFGIILCALLGEIWLALNHPVLSYSETIRSVLIYFLIVLAFGLGQRSANFNLKWLVWIFYISVLLNLLFIVFKSLLPSFIIDLYYPPMVTHGLDKFGVYSVEEFLELNRPRGLFGNPNTSILQLQIITLFIYLSARHKLLLVSSHLVAWGIILLPLLVALLLAARGGFILSAVLAIANYRILMGRFNLSKFKALFPFIIIIVIAYFALSEYLNIEAIKSNYERVTALFRLGGSSINIASDTFRPLIGFQPAFDRFLFSPLFGSGFSLSNMYPFDSGTQYYHNDIFRLIVTSGLIGFCLMIRIIRKYCYSLGFVTLTPFIVPGLTNTFLLTIPTMIFFFFMIAVIRQKIVLRTTTF